MLHSLRSLEIAALVFHILGSGAFVYAQPGPGHSLSELAWLAGDWQTAPGADRQVDEHWTVPLGGAMLGTSRTVAGGKMLEFEYLRIVEQEDGIYYIAHPGARTPRTRFKLTRVTADQVVFENPQHDFPKRITYSRGTGGSLTATVDGGEGTSGPTFRFRRMVK